ncbi:lycopene cyclase family protein [Microbacterium sp. SORGH_AS_0888]|uniref:lycopene cyclase family protein n=1 Tax=Microbacterium sp. SORGH_AS_0888 TaxID=3041791 RepID=UPI00277E1C9D|nr:lycopene cyclase family protein [Microbacterium sp. SORGH_AS_0888]MDQ1130380.1 2-polyprenyl-6-methoxyphenol hydroxylase-like FAD-dependent oxidoreductase [Microbacterium sp. SORGH_AS_0888]
MRIAVIGAGPAGLLFATIVARELPGSTVDLFERNGADEAFGFGVVFSDATQRGVDSADSALRTTLDTHGVRWDAIAVRLKGEEHAFAGNGMGAVLRKDLLAELQQGARDAGANLHFHHPIELADLGDYDIVVAADGANSRTRQAVGEDTLGVSFEYATAKFIWFATDHVFDGLTFLHQHVAGLGDVPGVFCPTPQALPAWSRMPSPRAPRSKPTRRPCQAYGRRVGGDHDPA